jgi:PTS system mannose-specific IIA component
MFRSPCVIATWIEGANMHDGDGRPDAGETEPGAQRSAPAEHSQAMIGVVLIGHGSSASALLDAARAISPDANFEGIIALDAGAGRDEVLDASACDVVAAVDSGRGALILVDLFGSSPCACGLAQSGSHEIVVTAGLNLAMLLKLVSLDRRELELEAIGEACADSARRSVVVKCRTNPGEGSQESESP